MPSTTFLRGILAYDPVTGDFTWRERFDVPAWWNSRYAGQSASNTDTYGYRVLRINGKTYKAHRIAWVYVTGRAIPEGAEIDHKNGVRSDNRFDNLRLASDEQNAANAKMRRDNKSGMKGVSWHRRVGKWAAQINVNGRRKHLGYFDTVESAHVVYQKHAVALHSSFVRL